MNELFISTSHSLRLQLQVVVENSCVCNKHNYYNLYFAYIKYIEFWLITKSDYEYLEVMKFLNRIVLYGTFASLLCRRSYGLSNLTAQLYFIIL